jgi:hypothetical protein
MLKNVTLVDVKGITIIYFVPSNAYLHYCDVKLGRKQKNGEKFFLSMEKQIVPSTTFNDPKD